MTRNSENELHLRNIESNNKATDLGDQENDLTVDDNKENKTGWKRLSFKEKLRRFFENITVEPLLACYVMPSVLASLAIQNLNLEKACRVNLNYGEDVCDRLIQQTDVNKTLEEVEVQTLVAYMLGWRLPMQTGIPAVIIMFIGAWSDRTGKRKPLMLIPFFGELGSSIGLMFCVYYFLQWPLEAAGVIEGLPPALTGGWATMFMAMFSYLADHTSEKDRTFRIGVVNMFISIAVPIGTALSGIMITGLGFYGTFAVSIAFYVVGLIYGVIRIRDKKKESCLEVAEEKGCKQGCRTFFDVRNLIDTFMVLFKKRNSNRRILTILLFLAFCFITGPVHGSGTVQYLYARRRYSFTENGYSMYSAYSIVMNFVGIIFALSVFSKYFQMNDSLLGAIACVGKIGANLVYAFAPTQEWLYLGPVVELTGGTAIIAMRSLASKIVEEDEIGKINSLFGVFEAIVNAIYTPIFSAFYVYTLATFPGAFCVLAAVLLIPAVGIFLYMYKLQKEDMKQKEEEDKKRDEKAEHAYDNVITSL